MALHSSRATPSDRTVIINEIGWGGTAASAADEWIELYNTANTSVDLAGWRLRAADGQPDVALSGTIGPLDYYLIERTDDSTISDIDGDLLSPFGTGLSNAGETLQLLDASGIAVDSANQDGGPWPNADEGAAPAYRSLERIDPLADDTDGNWASNDGSVINGLDNAGGAIQGTPRSANAAYLARFAAYADLKVEKRGPTHFSTDTPITFAISVTNTGTYTATEAIVTDPLADGLAFVDQAGQLPTGGQPAFSQLSTGLTWQLGDLAPGATGLVTLVVRLEDTGSAAGSTAGSLTNTVVVSTTADEIDLSDNEDTWTIEPDAAPILISAVLYDGYQLNDEDEAVELVNTGTTTGYLDGWSLCKDPGDGIACWPLPAMVVAPGARVWVAKDGAAFALSFGFPPDYVAASWPRFANTGDEVILRSPTAFYSGHPRLRRSRDRHARMDRPPCVALRQPSHGHSRADPIPKMRRGDRPPCAGHRHLLGLAAVAGRPRDGPPGALPRLGPGASIFPVDDHRTSPGHRRHCARQRLRRHIGDPPVGAARDFRGGLQPSPSGPAELAGRQSPSRR